MITSHGHHIPGTDYSQEEQLKPRARCGGPRICDKCSKETVKFIQDFMEPKEKK